MPSLVNFPTHLRSLLLPALTLALIVSNLWGCNGRTPSARLTQRVTLPTPRSATAAPDPARLHATGQASSYSLAPRSLIKIAFDLQPDIKSSYQKFKAQEARYDFFYSSRDSLTPRLKVNNNFDETRISETVTRDRDHAVELALEKRFFDTTELDLSTGFASESEDGAIGDRPFVSAGLRYPLWASRKRLERTSAEIFQRNELNDAQLNYIKNVRNRLESALIKYYEVVKLRRTVENSRQWKNDLHDLSTTLSTVTSRDIAADQQRIEAEITSVNSKIRNTSGRYRIDFSRLKSQCGIPFFANVTISDELFNPFENATHEELMRLSIDTDPEIATLRNARNNAEVQLDLARRGRWDVALLLDGTSNMEGRGENEGQSDWSVTVGFDVSAIDPRVVNSLAREAQADIARFSQAIAARENQIFVDTLEPLVRIDTLGQSRDELLSNLPRYQENYDSGIPQYLRGKVSIEDLLIRREDLHLQQEEVNRLNFMVGANIAELCSATGMFFELLNGTNTLEAAMEENRRDEDCPNLRAKPAIPGYKQKKSARDS